MSWAAAGRRGAPPGSEGSRVSPAVGVNRGCRVCSGPRRPSANGNRLRRPELSRITRSTVREDDKVHLLGASHRRPSIDRDKNNVGRAPPPARTAARTANPYDQTMVSHKSDLLPGAARTSAHAERSPCSIGGCWVGGRSLARSSFGSEQRRSRCRGAVVTLRCSCSVAPRDFRGEGGCRHGTAPARRRAPFI